MSDTDDLHGTIPTAMRWDAEEGILSIDRGLDEASGERNLVEIEFGTPKAKLVLDMSTRDRRYGKIAKGFYDMRLTPVGSPAPEWPNDKDYKPAVGMWLWNPFLGEVRFETAANMAFRTITGLWERIKTFEEYLKGLQPVIHFVDRREQHVPKFDTTYWVFVANIVSWFDRAQTPFQARPITVPITRPVDLVAVSPKLQNTLQQKLASSAVGSQAQQPEQTKPAAEAQPQATSNKPARTPRNRTALGVTVSTDPLPAGALDKDLDDKIPW